MIRFATIGTNFIVDRFLEAALANKEFAYKAAYSRNAETALSFSNKYHPERIYTDLNKLAEADDIDAVYIASPNSLHYGQASLLLEHSKHILCEKTITSNSKELQNLIQLAKSRHLVLLEAIRTVFTPGFAALTDNLSRLGTIRRVSFNYCQYSSRYDKFKSGMIENAFNPALSNGAIMDIGVYCVYPLMKLFGAPEEIKTNALILSNGIDGAGTILAIYKEMQAELVYSKITDSRIPSQIQGENGTMTITGINNPCQLKFYDRKGNEEIIYQAASQPDMSGEINEWARLIKGGSGGEIHNQCSLLTLKLMDEARRQMGIVFPADKNI